MLQFSKDSSSIISKLKIKDINLGNYSLVAYGKGMELPAFTYQRAKINLEGKIIKTIPIYELLFLEDAYADEKNLLIFLNDVSESKEVLDNLWSLGINADIFTCQKLKEKGNTKITEFEGELCETNLSLSILNNIAKSLNSHRSKRILEELDFSDLKDWIEKKSSEVDLNLPEIIISPVLLPSKYYVEENLGKIVKTYYDTNFSNSTLIYTGIDTLVMRRISFELKKNNYNVKELLLDTEPLMAPIYLTIISYILKNKIK